MKRLDMTDICVVYSGEKWRHALPPCSKEMMTHLERNERLVSWLQPIRGTVHDQLPAIRFNDEYYSISLRMMKAIWRHVRLRKGFNNVERAPYGGWKLKIPVSLLAEKLRTQSRFNVMRMSTPHIASPAVKERKVSLSASCKVDNIIRQLFMPMLSMPTPERTSFLAEDAEDQLLRQVAQERPSVLASEVAFVDYMVLLYRKFQRESCGALDSARFGAAETSEGEKTMSIASSMPRECHKCHELCGSRSSHASECHESLGCSGFSEFCKPSGCGSQACSESTKHDEKRINWQHRNDCGHETLSIDKFRADPELESKIDPKSACTQLGKQGALTSPNRTHSKGPAKPRGVQRNRVRSKSDSKTCQKTIENLPDNPMQDVTSCGNESTNDWQRKPSEDQ